MPSVQALFGRSATSSTLGDPKMDPPRFPNSGLWGEDGEAGPGAG